MQVISIKKLNKKNNCIHDRNCTNKDKLIKDKTTK